MVRIEDLKRINMMKDFPDHVLEKIAAEAHLSIFSTHARLLVINEPVDAFYMLIMGQVAIKNELTPDIDVVLDYIQSGSSFGSSAFMEGATATYTAVCQEPCEAITLSGNRMRKMMGEDRELAFYLLRGVARQYKKKMDTRAHMIIKTLDEHPELKPDILDIHDLTLAF